ncbi:MAG: hypothetical protein U0871_29780 [Gemmataceae bacterium]
MESACLRLCTGAMPDLSFLYALAPADPASDADLLRRFADHRDGPAFELLVRRHANLAWKVCRAAHPRDVHAAEDAFQATFLALARNGGGGAGERRRVAVSGGGAGGPASRGRQPLVSVGDCHPGADAPGSPTRCHRRGP